MVSLDDFQAAKIRATGRAIDISGGFRHAASAQSIYFPAGTIAEYKRLLAALRAFHVAWPSIAQARQVFAELRRSSSLYTLNEEACGTWEIAIAASATFENPFEKGPKVIGLESPAGVISIVVDEGEAVATLDIFRHLGGAATVEELVGLRALTRSAQELVGILESAGLLTDGGEEECHLNRVPQFLFLGHSSFAVRDCGDVVLVDPILHPAAESSGLAGRGPLDIATRAAAILISHNHWDHLNFQTLCRLPREKLIVVPRVSAPTYFNPPVAMYLKALGFTRILEVSAGDVFDIGAIRVRIFPFFGEPFGLRSHFDGFTYHLTFSGLTLYGNVDASRDEAGSMEPVMQDVAALGPLDILLFGATGQFHDPPFRAGGLARLSNELRARPELIRYHADLTDVARWTNILRPRILVPYADFRFGRGRADSLSPNGPGRWYERDVRFCDELGPVPADLEPLHSTAARVGARWLPLAAGSGACLS